MSLPKLSLVLVLAVVWGFQLVKPSGSASDEQALNAFKRAISEDPLSMLSDWNSLSGDYCSWSGVRCSQNHVISLDLSNSSLKGFLAPELGLLNSLQELTLANNLLYGTIPKKIGLLKNLSILDLSMNRLVGPIPSEIGELSSIKKINLSSNELTGGIPPELGKLDSLTELLLERNRLTGRIPAGNNPNVSRTVHGLFASQNNATGLCQSPQLKNGDFSYNFLDGKIPSCFLHTLPMPSFQGNCFQDEDAILQRPSTECLSMKNYSDSYKSTAEDGEHRKTQQPQWLLILEITTGVLLAIFLLAYIAATVRRCKPKTSAIIPWKRNTNWKDQVSISIDNVLLNNTLKLSRQELEVACEDFSNIIGSSPDSKVYKGTMSNGKEIAVISICISEGHWTRYLELYFQREVAELSRLNHENISKLLGYCKESGPFSRMLVFEYASNGTLYEHLHYGEGGQLFWLRRMKIAIGIARGLRYLHTELKPPFTISELTSNSVYLTEDFSPKLLDFESWKSMISKSENSGYITNSGQLNGCADSVERRHMDIQGNTYYFGVLLLELISGRPSYCENRGDLVDWAMQYLSLPDKLRMIVDPELKNVKSDDLSVIFGVLSLCLVPEPLKRPSMQIICAMLEDGIDISTRSLPKESPLAWAELALTS